MTKIARILANPVTAMVEGVDQNDKVALSDGMSYVVDGHEHMNSGGWDGRSTMFDFVSSKFPAGFVPTATAILSKLGYQVQVVKKPLPTPLGPMPVQGNALVDNFPADPDRDYQFKCVQLLERNGSFIARVATGGGKSRIAALCIKRIGRKTIFVTTRSVLLYQMGEALEEIGFKVSYIGDGVWDTSGDVVCAMVQTLAERLSPYVPPMKMTADEKLEKIRHYDKRRDEAAEFLESIEFVIGEEAHEAGGNGYFEVLKRCRKAYYRLALTATPLMRDGESDMRLIASFGPVGIEVSEEQLIRCGILATPIFKFITIGKDKQPPTLRQGSSWQVAEEMGIVDNHIRNKHVCAEIIRASRWGLSAVALVKRKKHGKVLHEMLQQAGMRGTYIYGDSKKEIRKAAIKKLENGEYDYLIGSTIMDVGVDMPSIGVLVMAGGGKAEVAIRQRIGRALRRKKNLPNFAFVVEFEDQNNKHLVKHTKARRAIVDQTPGFCENVVKRGQDFDFAKYGFKPIWKAAA